jgi:hypothetical protein
MNEKAPPLSLGASTDDHGSPKSREHRRPFPARHKRKSPARGGASRTHMEMGHLLGRDVPYRSYRVLSASSMTLKRCGVRLFPFGCRELPASRRKESHAREIAARHAISALGDRSGQCTNDSGLAPASSRYGRPERPGSDLFADKSGALRRKPRWPINSTPVLKKAKCA